MGRVCSSVVKSLPGVHKDLSSTPSTTKRRRQIDRLLKMLRKYDSECSVIDGTSVSIPIPKAQGTSWKRKWNEYRIQRTG